MVLNKVNICQSRDKCSKHQHKCDTRPLGIILSITQGWQDILLEALFTHHVSIGSVLHHQQKFVYGFVICIGDVINEGSCTNFGCCLPHNLAQNGGHHVNLVFIGLQKWCRCYEF